MPTCQILLKSLILKNECGRLCHHSKRLWYFELTAHIKNTQILEKNRTFWMMVLVMSVLRHDWGLISIRSVEWLNIFTSSGLAETDANHGMFSSEIVEWPRSVWDSYLSQRHCNVSLSPATKTWEVPLSESLSLSLRIFEIALKKPLP
jgi:hypothetical protein